MAALRTEPGRTLYHIPIVHTQEDMGSLGSWLSRDPRSSIQDLARAYWTEVRDRVQALGHDWRGVKVYQDGMPDAGMEVVQKVVDQVHSPNYDLLRWLMAEGAELVGTESPALLKEEYDLLQQALRASDVEAKARARRAYCERASDLLAERDSYIAGRIAQTLPYGGTGLLFVGLAHRVTKSLAADIAVIELLPTVTRHIRALDRTRRALHVRD